MLQHSPKLSCFSALNLLPPCRCCFPAWLATEYGALLMGRNMSGATRRRADVRHGGSQSWKANERIKINKI
eukprot:6963838-Alexandrium_andersonii.AAC.1